MLEWIRAQVYDEGGGMRRRFQKRSTSSLRVGLSLVFITALALQSQLVPHADAKKRHKTDRCQYGILIGVGKISSNDKPDTGPNKTLEGMGVVQDAGLIKGVLVSNWDFKEKQLDRATYLNDQGTKKNIESAFNDAIGEAKHIPRDCVYYHVKIHFEGHGRGGTPTDAKDIFKGLTAPAGNRKGFEAWDGQKSAANGIVWDFEIADRVKQIRDALAATVGKTDGKTKWALKNYQVIVQVDTCFSEALLSGTTALDHVSTAWSSSKTTNQQFPLVKGSPWTKGFLEAFQGADGDTDETKHVTVEEAHKAAANRANEYGKNPNEFDKDANGNRTKPYVAGSDYAPKNQTPPIDPGILK
jgi:hypothetical protein